jgi:opacity protein-like surface antigen
MFALALASALVAASPSPSPTPTPDPCAPILAIVTRPTVTTSACTVRTHHVLLETGYTNTTVTGPGSGNAVTYPQAFLRVGTGNSRLEFAFTPPSSNASSTGGTVVGGTSDMNFGAKYELGTSAAAVWGVNAQVSIPSGSRAFSAGGAQYTGNFNWSYTLNSEFSLAGTLGFNSLAGYNANGNVQHFFAFIPSVELEAALPANSQLFAEYAYFSQAGVGLGGRSLLDFGFQHDFTPHLQFDVEYGVQPTTLGGQRQHYVGAGLAFMTSP